MKRLCLLAFVLAALAVAGCDDDETSPASGVELTAFERCEPPRGGGYDVWVQGMDCAEVTQQLLISMPVGFAHYRSLPDSKRQVSDEGKDGWICWSALESDYGPIHNVCRRNDQTLIFYQG